MPSVETRMTRGMTVMTPWVLCALVLAVGCDGSRPVQHDDGATRDGAVHDTSRSDLRPPPDSARRDATDRRCVIAYRYTKDDGCCCRSREAVEAAALAADPCLVEVSAEGLLPQAPSGCPYGCNLACDCMAPDAPSRVVAWRGGGCAFVGECTTAGDCELATNTRNCCACPEAYPRAVVASDPCLVAGSVRGTPASMPCSPGCDWQCPTAGDCASPQPDCQITAKLPIPEKICIGY